MFRTLSFLEIFYKNFNIKIIGGIPKNQSKITTHLSEDFFYDILIKPFIPYISYRKPYKFFNFLNISSMEKPQAKGEIFNVGTGEPITIKTIAEILTQKINPEKKLIITNKYRTGDIRHCYSDITKIKQKLGYKPKISFENGIEELIQWVKFQVGKVEDKSRKALEELKRKDLI
ncbi:hypothetical protein ES706_05665 [subsurface metagenome]